MSEAPKPVTSIDPQDELLAYSVEINYMSCIVFATSASKARWIAVKAYREAGYGADKQWPWPVAHRAPRHDNNPRKKDGPRAWSEQYL